MARPQASATPAAAAPAAARAAVAPRAAPRAVPRAGSGRGRVSGPGPARARAPVPDRALRLAALRPAALCLAAVLLALAAAAPAAAAETLYRAARTIAAGSTVAAEDLVPRPAPGAGFTPVGQTARITIFAGRPVRAADLGPPVLVARNQAVLMRYSAGALTIEDLGRALEPGAAGERIRALNLGSKAVVTGVVAPDGTLRLGPHPAGDSP